MAATLDVNLLADRTRRRQRREAFITHLCLIIGVLIFAFPIYLTVIGSTHDVNTIGRGDVPLVPGGEAVANYA